ncbi:hypothetical protein [Flavobacterium phycosphaerae]|uniref:hypothetical protein n=1 Tax=Flavobacterium phycosphaerae TaxID=2697515 RepID=UPI00138B0E3D|nr:hypothetical protein [Flavobacterium phycosphaerae]
MATSRKNDTITKKSGCKLTKYYPETGANKGVQQFLFTAWKKSEHGFLSVRAVTTSKSQQPNNSDYMGSIAVTIINKDTGSKTFYWGVMHVKDEKVRIPELGWVLNPKANNGGFCGKSQKPKK